MRTKNLDLIVVISIVVLNVVWTLIPDRLPLVGMIFALPLTFILPGYALLQTLIHRRAPNQLLETDVVKRQLGLKKGRPPDGVDLFVLSLGLSLAIDVLVGFMLNVLPWGLQALSWALSLGLFIIICAVLAIFFRRGEMPPVARARRLRMTPYDGLLFGLAILVATGAIWFAVVRSLEPPPSFTQFWMLPADAGSESCAVSMGVRNFEVTPVTYHVILIVDGSEIGMWSAITLAPNSTWMQSAAVKPGSTNNLKVEAQLYRENEVGIIYRDVHLTFYTVIGEQNGQKQQKCML